MSVTPEMLNSLHLTDFDIREFLTTNKELLQEKFKNNSHEVQDFDLALYEHLFKVSMVHTHDTGPYEEFSDKLADVYLMMYVIWGLTSKYLMDTEKVALRPYDVILITQRLYEPMNEYIHTEYKQGLDKCIKLLSEYMYEYWEEYQESKQIIEDEQVLNNLDSNALRQFFELFSSMPAVYKDTSKYSTPEDLEKHTKLLNLYYQLMKM